MDQDGGGCCEPEVKCLHVETKGAVASRWDFSSLPTNKHLHQQTPKHMDLSSLITKTPACHDPRHREALPYSMSAILGCVGYGLEEWDLVSQGYPSDMEV